MNSKVSEVEGHAEKDTIKCNICEIKEDRIRANNPFVG